MCLVTVCVQCVFYQQPFCLSWPPGSYRQRASILQNKTSLQFLYISLLVFFPRSIFKVSKILSGNLKFIKVLKFSVLETIFSCADIILRVKWLIATEWFEHSGSLSNGCQALTNGIALNLSLTLIWIGQGQVRDVSTYFHISFHSWVEIPWD